jgi:hypothetical protein
VNGVGAHCAISWPGSKLPSVDQSLIEKGRIAARYAEENQKTRKNPKFHHNSFLSTSPHRPSTYAEELDRNDRVGITW